MPIEIKELHIKAVVGAREREMVLPLKQEDIAKLKKEITKEVTEKILKTLRQKNER
jgi:phenylpyruvate tautomerase PptA (4-oxalocrotonate tautomerase family)